MESLSSFLNAEVCQSLIGQMGKGWTHSASQDKKDKARTWTEFNSILLVLAAHFVQSQESRSNRVFTAWIVFPWIDFISFFNSLSLLEPTGKRGRKQRRRWRETIRSFRVLIPTKILEMWKKQEDVESSLQKTGPSFIFQIMDWPLNFVPLPALSFWYKIYSLRFICCSCNCFFIFLLLFQSWSIFPHPCSYERGKERERERREREEERKSFFVSINLASSKPWANDSSSFTCLHFDAYWWYQWKEWVGERKTDREKGRQREEGNGKKKGGGGENSLFYCRQSLIGSSGGLVIIIHRLPFSLLAHLSLRFFPPRPSLLDVTTTSMILFLWLHQLDPAATISGMFVLRPPSYITFHPFHFLSLLWLVSSSGQSQIPHLPPLTSPLYNSQENLHLIWGWGLKGANLVKRDERR